MQRYSLTISFGDNVLDMYSNEECSIIVKMQWLENFTLRVGKNAILVKWTTKEYED